MATTANELRRDVLSGITEARTEIEVLLDRTIADIARAARQNQNNQDRFAKQVLIAITAFWASYQLLSRRSNRKIATTFAEYVNATVGARLERAGATETLATLRRQTDAYPKLIEQSVLNRKSPYDGRSIRQRIVTIQKANTAIVEKLLKTGIDNGLNVNQVARSIQNYVDPQSQSGQRFTKGNGIDYRAVKIDKRLPKNSIRYNAVRIARTEIMTTYDIASRAYYQNKPWSSGWDWFTSNTHIGPDACDVLRDASPHKTLPKRPHPQCACNARPRVPSIAEFEQLVKDGKIR